MIPKESEKSVTVGRTALMDTLRRVSLDCQDKTFGVRIELGDGHMTVTSQNPDLGEARRSWPPR